ncbi:MAG: hypothetical protein M1818_000063 [Claussenomyces sp. TS43310]|nr:MAG: hypothetical protein M1818_000063 [Claussenomyces sp. TS43310]
MYEDEVPASNPASPGTFWSFEKKRMRRAVKWCISEIFGGIPTTEFLEPPLSRSFCSRQAYRAMADSEIDEATAQLIDCRAKPSGPPPHLHRYQTEYFKVEEGIMGVNIDGKVYKKKLARSRL